MEPSAEEVRATRAWLQKQFRTCGLQMDPGALNYLVQVAHAADDPEELVHSIMDEASSDGKTLVGLEYLQNLVRAREGAQAGPSGVQIILANQAPLLEYDAVRKQFHASSSQPHLFGEAKSKSQLYVNRYHLVQQRLRRNRFFRKTQLPGPAGSSGADYELTELKALLGTVSEKRYVLGFLSSPEEGRYALEDLSARLPLDISGADCTQGLFTENCIVIAEGSLQPNGTFLAAALGLPPPEARPATVQALQGLETFGGKALDDREGPTWEAVHPGDRTVLLSDAWLDDAHVLLNIEAALSTFSAENQSPPSVLVLAGNFLSPAAARGVRAGGVGPHAASYLAEFRRGMQALARVLAKFPRLLESTTLVLVPGPEDIGLGCSLPHLGIPKTLAASVLAAAPNTVLGSNPCRLRHGRSDVVIARGEFHRLLRGSSVIPPQPGPSPFVNVVATMAQQAHLWPCPLEAQPIHWEQDQALWLHPLPHALLLADSLPAEQTVFEGCMAASPGSLRDGTYCSFNPVACTVALHSIELEADAGVAG